MCKNKDHSLWSMVIFWPVSGTAYFPVLKSFPFIRKGSKPPPDFPILFPLNKEAASSGPCPPHCPPLATQVCSAPQLRDPLLPSLVREPPKHSPASLTWELLSRKFNGKNGEKPCSPHSFYFSLVDKRAFSWRTSIEFLCAWALCSAKQG